MVADRDLVRRARHAPAQAAAGLGPLTDAIAARFRAWALEPPRPQDVPREMQAPEPQVRAALDVLIRAGRLVRIRPDYFVDKDVLSALRDKLRAHLAAHGQITSQEWKTITAVSRKYMIPLAEHFDAEKVTMRVGEVRKPRG